MKLDLAGLKLKLHKVHFVVKFSEAEAQPRRSRGAAEAEENLTAKWTECNFIPMSTRW